MAIDMYIAFGYVSPHATPGREIEMGKNTSKGRTKPANVRYKAEQRWVTNKKLRIARDAHAKSKKATEAAS